MTDFDKAFEEYALDWFNRHADEYEDASAMEESMPLVYEQWAETPSSLTEGISPRAYFASIRKPDELLSMLCESCEGESNPCSLLLDRVAECPDCAQGLIEILTQKQNVKLRMIAINLLTEMGAAHPLHVYADWICDNTIDSGLRELGIEILCEHADAVSDKLFGLLPAADGEQKKILAEILVHAQKDERTYTLLCELFATGDNIPLYAGLIGKYGDERASGMLYRALDTCNYLEYIEIKNAIERMGGVVDDVRDFSDDVYYKAIKNLK